METETETLSQPKPMTSFLPALKSERIVDLASSQCQTCGERAGKTGRVDALPCPECVERWGLCAVCGSMRTVTNSVHGEPSSPPILEPCIYPHEATATRESDAEYARFARVPQHYSNCRFENWEQPRNGGQLRQVQAYCNSWPPIDPVLILHGDPGTGKTHLAIGALFAMRQLHGDKALGRFWPVIDLLERFRRTFDADRATETIEQVEESLTRVPVLVLDDFGAHKSSEWAEERLFKLIDTRYSAGKTLIVTTNMTLQELPPRVKSRLAAGAVVQFAKLPDRRLAS